MSISANIQLIRQQIPEHVKLVCVSKYHPDEDILEAYQIGERVFGESKVQEMCGKFERLPKDISWHFIGHLQSNKIKYIVPFVDLIHGVDSFKLLNEINKQAEKANLKIKCLLQIHIAKEDTKFGFSSDELFKAIESDAFNGLKNIEVCGLMGMATFTDNRNQVRSEFQTLKLLFDTVKQLKFSKSESFDTISMGMSDDFTLAIEEGSTMVRVGSSIFGSRIYS